MRIVTTPPAVLISTLPPSRRHERAALTVSLLLLALFISALSVARTPLPRVDSIIPVVSTAMFVGDCVTAVLLFGQFAVLRTRALLVLAGGYLFTGLIVVTYALTFPGAFAPDGLLGAGIQTAGWIFLAWHLGLPVTVLAYALLENAPAAQREARLPVPKAIMLAGGIATAMALVVSWATTALHDRLPPVLVDGVHLIGERTLLSPVVLCSFTAVLVLWRRRRSVLDLWLLVVAFAWLLDAFLTYFTESRFTLAWYANRVVRVVSANVVLFVLLAESARLYARISASILAQQHERESRAMSLEAMSAAIEHEVRQPLASIVANASAARRWMEHSPPNLGEAREALGDIAAEARRASEMLHAVRGIFARGGDEQSRFDVNRLIEEAVAMLRAELGASSIGVQLHLDAGLPEIVADRVQLREVVVNLVRNAADAMRTITDHATVLSITSARTGADHLSITVADTGAGINAEDRQRLFDAFFTTKPDGFGMGLAICKSIVERHGGTLSAEPAEPFGSVFRVVLPLRA